MSPQVACPRGCIITLVAFVRYFSVHPLHVLSQCGVQHLPLPVTAHSRPFPGTEYCTSSTLHTGPYCTSVHTWCILRTIHLALHCILDCELDFKVCTGEWSTAKVQYQRSFQAIPSSAKVMQSTAELAICPLHSFSPVHWENTYQNKHWYLLAVCTIVLPCCSCHKLGSTQQQKIC